MSGRMTYNPVTGRYTYRIDPIIREIDGRDQQVVSVYGDPMTSDQQIEHDPTNDNVTESVVVATDKSE